MISIDFINREMKKINDLTDEVYEAMADGLLDEAKVAIRKLHKVLDKLNAHELLKKSI